MKAIVAACALAIPALASADDVGHWYVNPNFGGVSVDNDRPVQDKDWLYGFGIGRHMNRWLSTELNVTGAQVGGGPGRSDLSLWGTSLDLLGVMNRDGRVSPYVSVGLGALSNEPSPVRTRPTSCHKPVSACSSSSGRARMDRKASPCVPISRHAGMTPAPTASCATTSVRSALRTRSVARRRSLSSLRCRRRQRRLRRPRPAAANWRFGS